MSGIYGQLFLMTAVTLATTGLTYTNSYCSPGFQRCGCVLVESVTLACHMLGGVYEPNLTSKRSNAIDVQPSSWKENVLLSFTTRPKRRRLRGIVAECCLQPCSIRFIQNNYCQRRPSPNHVDQSPGAFQVWQAISTTAATEDGTSTMTTTTATPASRYGRINNQDSPSGTPVYVDDHHLNSRNFPSDYEIIY